MKQRLFIGALILVLLAGCTVPTPEATTLDAPTVPVSEEVSSKTPEAVLSGTIFRVGDVALLTGEQGLFFLPETDIENGSLVTVSYDGAILESFPAQFANLYEVTATDRAYNHIGLYQQAIGDLMSTDEALNDDIVQLVFDFTKAAHLTQPEINAILYWAAYEYNVTTSEGTYSDLIKNGSVSEEDFPHFSDGLLIQLEVFDDTGDSFGFHINKWRSALGAYFFHNCTAQTNAGAPYDYTYTIGEHMIS